MKKIIFIGILLLAFLIGCNAQAEDCYYVYDDKLIECVKPLTKEGIQKILDESPPCDFEIEKIDDKCYLKDKNGVCPNFIGTINSNGECADKEKQNQLNCSNLGIVIVGDEDNRIHHEYFDLMDKYFPIEKIDEYAPCDIKERREIAIYETNNIGEVLNKDVDNDFAFKVGNDSISISGLFDMFECSNIKLKERDKLMREKCGVSCSDFKWGENFDIKRVLNCPFGGD